MKAMAKSPGRVIILFMTVGKQRTDCSWFQGGMVFLTAQQNV